jgi:hypothetical protein
MILHLNGQPIISLRKLSDAAAEMRSILRAEKLSLHEAQTLEMFEKYPLQPNFVPRPHRPTP